MPFWVKQRLLLKNSWRQQKVEVTIPYIYYVNQDLKHSGLLNQVAPEPLLLMFGLRGHKSHYLLSLSSRKTVGTHLIKNHSLNLIFPISQVANLHAIKYQRDVLPISGSIRVEQCVWRIVLRVYNIVQYITHNLLLILPKW